jgi:predicted nucleic acid-binding protein
MRQINDEYAVFIDSNIWLYAKLDNEGHRQKSIRARQCISEIEEVIISSQILVEVGNNLLKKGKLEESRVRMHLLDLLDSCELIPINRAVILSASNLRVAGTYSYWDSLIIAAALESGCTQLWSEDLQEGRVIEKTLTIINPLIER